MPSRGPFDKFTVRARNVLQLAQEEARRLNHNYIGTEHVLLGLIAEGGGIAAKVLTSIGLDLDSVRAAVEEAVGPGEAPVLGEIGLTPRGRRVIEKGVAEARKQRHRFIGTEHLLLGLLQVSDGMGYRILQRLADVAAIQAQTLAVIANADPEEVPAEPLPKSNVVMCRLDDEDLNALDTLIEAGVRTTRSDAAAWLIRAGIQTNGPLFESVRDKVAQIRQLREEARSLANQTLTP
jgi:ATP-dependent Clp protease ATP-binding subunit ClpA